MIKLELAAAGDITEVGGMHVLEQRSTAKGPEEWEGEEWDSQGRYSFEKCVEFCPSYRRRCDLLTASQGFSSSLPYDCCCYTEALPSR